MQQLNFFQLSKNQVSLAPTWLEQAAAVAFFGLLATLLTLTAHAQTDPPKQGKATDKNPPAAEKWIPPYNRPPKLELLFQDDFAKDTRKQYHITSKRTAAKSTPGGTPDKPPIDSAVQWQSGRLILHDGAVISRKIDGDNWCELKLDLKFSEPAEGQSTRLVIRLDLEPSTDSYVELSQYWRDGKLRSRIAVFDMRPLALLPPRKIRSIEFDSELPHGKWRIGYRGGFWSVRSPQKGTGLLAHIENGVVRINRFSLEVGGNATTCSKLVIRRVVPPSVTFSKEQRERLAVAGRLNGRVYRLWRQGRSKDALQLAKRAVQIRKQILGDYHPDTQLSVFNLGAQYAAINAHTIAEELYKRALEIVKKTLGEDHPDYASSLNNLARLYVAVGRYADAASLFKRIMEIKKTTLGEEDPDYAMSLNNLIYVYISLARFSEAELLCNRALDIIGTTRREEYLSRATILNHLALLYEKSGRYSEAEVRYKQAMQILSKTHSEEDPAFAITLDNLGLLYVEMGRFVEGEDLIKRAMVIFERALGKDDPHYATSVHNLAHTYVYLGRFSEAESLYKQAMEICQKHRGREHPDYATSLHNLAFLYESIGRYVDAEPLYKQAMVVMRKAYGEQHPVYATSLNNLAGLYTLVGRYTDAEPLYRRATEIRRRTLGEKHPAYGASLNNLAYLYQKMGRYENAERQYQQAEAVLKHALGETHFDYVVTLNNLALLYNMMGHPADAEPLARRALDIRREIHGTNHHSFATSLSNLAHVYRSMGRCEDAASRFRRAADVFRNSLGEEHPHYVTSLDNLATTYTLLGRFGDADALFQKVVDISLRNLELSANVQSERQQIAMNRSLRHQLDNYMSMGHAFRAQADVKPQDAAALNARIYRSVLAWKGAVTARQRAVRLAAHADPRLQTRLRELQSVTSQLATLAFGTPKPGQQQVWRQRIVELTEKRDELQAQLSGQTSEFRQTMRRATLEQLRAVLPEHVVLVDCLEYWQHGSSRPDSSKTESENRLAAFIVRRTGPIRRVELGSAESLEELVKQWRAGYGVTSAASGAGARLRKQIWEPLEKAWNDSETGGEAKRPTILVSPDGVLARLPWGALPGREPGRFLIEEYPIAVVAAPQDLPRLLAADRHKSVPSRSMLLMAAVDYDSKPGTMPSSPAKRKSFFELATAGSRAPRDTDGAKYEFLSGTKGELRDIRDLYYKRFGTDGLTVLESAAASESAFRREAPNHLYLHVATHGFFAPESVRSALDRSVHDHHATGFKLLSEQRISGYHPDLLSGIVFAGANRSDLKGDDGIATAAEVAAMDLSSVRVCVLSACETGLGRRAGGEGLLGLQRAFQIAGADTVVASLWEVEDSASRDLMERFYDNLWNKELGKLESLREAQLWMLRERGLRGLEFEDADRPQRLPPFYWAAFVLSGDWR